MHLMALSTTPNDVKQAELELAVAVYCHCSTSSVDHIGEMIKKNGKGSILGKINLHRTKCSKLITEVVSPTLKQELKKDLDGEKFALLVDESADVGAVKYLCIAIRYCSKKEKRIVTEFVGLIPVNDTTGEALFSVIKAAVTNLGLELGNCIGFASDGASVMTGVNNSVWTRIQQESPDCVQASGADARYKARMISDIRNDPINYWHFQCVTSIVMEFERVNSYFQATDADPQSMEGELAQHHHSLRAKVFSPDGSELAISEVYFGARFAGSGEVYRDASTRVPYKDLPFPTLRTYKCNAIEQQYRNVLHLNWVEEAVFDNKIPDDYSVLDRISNAVVERIFSHATIVKTKLRNRLSTRTLDDIIRIRTHLHFRAFIKKCSLKSHTMSHNGEKPVQCDQCDAAFSEKV
ncbi:uncharacterized protein LOC143030398 [Oratosquilla oratoria]|uniref:uncharacterized protein LOC143030398 n=1 Tax=Oratosquilla oratoria TaxID=337810 RepID=UPI003F75AED4